MRFQRANPQALWATPMFGGSESTPGARGCTEGDTTHSVLDAQSTGPDSFTWFCSSCVVGTKSQAPYMQEACLTHPEALRPCWEGTGEPGQLGSGSKQTSLFQFKGISFSKVFPQPGARSQAIKQQARNSMTLREGVPGIPVTVPQTLISP